ncbi:putative TonB-dependent receptor [Desulfosarcina variabilis str. Montpellier]|uniref:TonB-dependent receptor plug domain-containing protein n=1 Tax=Desulfosarcina variabilis TaxID=2300 RepID=UPI003AFAB3AF
MCFRLVLAVLTMAVLMNPGLRPAQASKQDVMQIDEMVVSATRREKKIEDVPASISVITSDAIEKTATVTLDDVFRYTPAVRVTRGQGMSHWHSSISIRGWPLTGQGR